MIEDQLNKNKLKNKFIALVNAVRTDDVDVVEGVFFGSFELVGVDVGVGVAVPPAAVNAAESKN